LLVKLILISNLAGGPHSVNKDASNCSAELEVIMPDAVLINPTAVTYDCQTIHKQTE
jgi:hypothetical protein